MPDALDSAVRRLAETWPGPGGACSVLKDGEPIVRHAWGFANAELRIPFTPSSLFRICSITKQFTCAAVLDACPDPSALDAEVRARLPRLEGPAPRAVDLANNQSGLRDYWALAMLMGSPAEAPFGDREAALVIAQSRTTQFAPGTSFSYVNQNFRLLGDILQAREDRPFAQILRRRLFDPAGMESALLAADTRALPDGSEGYEGSTATGYRPAVNRILWTGDAGMAASLDDMIAWERWIDAQRDDPSSLWGRVCAPATFADGAPAAYGYGLGRSHEHGRAVFGHGGALRGWRSHRLHVPAERLSVVVMFNHLTDAGAAARELLAAALGETAPAAPAAASPPAWLGAWIEPASGLSARIDQTEPGRVRVRYGHWPEMLDLAGDGAAASAAGTRLEPDGDGLRLVLPGENRIARLTRLGRPGRTDVAGVWRCAEMASELTLADAGGVLYGAFSGPLGQSRMEQLEPVGEDVWTLPCWRALDHTPPGDWTVAVEREAGRPARLRVGCWLARDLRYQAA